MIFRISLLLCTFSMVRASNYIVVADGRFLCNGTSVTDQLVQLVEKSYVFSDRVISQQKTNFNGEFWIFGNASTDGFVYKMSEKIGVKTVPYLYIEHNCVANYLINGELYECSGIYRRKIPEMYIIHGNEDKGEKYIYDMGTVELADTSNGQGDHLGFDIITDSFKLAKKCKKA